MSKTDKSSLSELVKRLVMCLFFLVMGCSVAFAGLPLTDAKCIVISPSSLVNEANALSNFHSTNEGISSTVVTTESIDASYFAVENPPFEGYKNNKLSGWRNIKNYNYTLAKKIIAYLRDTAAHPELVYVAILGDALLVPPSYYYYYDSGQGSYSNWVPTDFFYISPEYDFIPNFKVGRLSVNNAIEAAQLVNKIINWHSIANASWFQKAYLVGADPWSDGSYMAERISTEFLNEGFLSGIDITKCYESDGRHAKEYVEPAIKNADIGILYLMGHGSGQTVALKTDNTYLTADELMQYPEHAKTPIVIASGCYNGAYDLDLVARTFPHGFGEAILKSQAGGIAYIGGVRYNAGILLMHNEQGNSVGERFTNLAAIFNNIFYSYHQGPNTAEAFTLGKLCFDALDKFQAENNMNEAENQPAVFMYVCLGDPALVIPAPQPAPSEYIKPSCTASDPILYDGANIPVYANAPVTINASTDAPSVIWKLINCDTRTTQETSAPTSSLSYTFSQGEPALYLVRVSVPAGVPSTDYAQENWFYYRISTNVIHISSINMIVATTGKTKYAKATVTVVNASGASVPGATVSGHWSGLTSDTDSGTTDNSGQVILSSDSVSKGSVGTFTFCVDNVILPGGAYDSGANVMTCNSINIP